MQTFTVQNTGLDHLYPDGVPVAESVIQINSVLRRVARRTSLAVLSDPYFSAMTKEARAFSELHPEGDRISKDFLMEGLTDILPIFTPLQRWMHGGNLVEDVVVNGQTMLAANLPSFLGGYSAQSSNSQNVYLNFNLPSTIGSGGILYKFEYNSVTNPGMIVVRWLILDTRGVNYKDYYTNITKIDIRNDLNMIQHVNKYMNDALEDYILKEFYRTIGYDKKYLDYRSSYEQNRSYVAFWAKNDTSLQTQYNNP